MVFVIMMGMISVGFLHNYHSHQESTETIINADDIHNKDPATFGTKNVHNEQLFYRQKVLPSLVSEEKEKQRQREQQEQKEEEEEESKSQLEKLKEMMADVKIEEETKLKTDDGDEITVTTTSMTESETESETTETETETVVTSMSMNNNNNTEQQLMRRQKQLLLRQNNKEIQKKEDERLNIVLFYADDWTMKVLGKLDPNQIVKTPNIDEMANNGMIFTNNCVTTSVCWISRSTLCTGTYSNIHKHTMPFDEAKFETKNWNQTLYPKMKNNYDNNNNNNNNNKDNNSNGYYTGLFGKWHKLEVWEEINEAFHEQKVYYGKHWEKRHGQQRHVTDLNKDDSINFLNNWYKRQQSNIQLNKQPFFLTTSFFATHARDGEIPSYQPKNDTRIGMYPDWSKDVPIPKTATEQHFKELPPFLAQFGNEGRTRWNNRFEPKDYQKSIKDMYAMATEVDTAIGEIIEKIKKLNVYENTLLIFTTDNGNMHGEHGLAEKWYPFEESIRVPLVIQDPRMPKHRHGTTSDAWTLNVDLAPTILGAANIEPASFMQGRDISDLYLLLEQEEQEEEQQEQKQEQSVSRLLSNNDIKKKVNWRTDWFYEFNLGEKDDGSDHPWINYIDASFALITDDWKYVVWPQHDDYEQLFHRSMDPYEEWDLLNKLLRNQTSALSTYNSSAVINIQTTEKIYKQMKERFVILKQEAQGGNLI
jgi:arylsulfatase